MSKQNSNQTSLGNLFGVVGFITGCAIGWNGTQNFWAAVICGLIVAGLGVAVGNLVQKVLIIAVSILLTIGTSYCRHQVLTVIRNGPSQGQTTGQATAAGRSVTTPTSARVIVRVANLRPTPSASNAPGNEPLLKLGKGDTLQLVSPNHDGNGWYQVRHSVTGAEGWIHGNNIEFE